MRVQQPPHNPDSASPRPACAPPLPPLPNYTLSTVCPACGAPSTRLACKVRCPRCGFVWDCGEL
ncbi:MAG: hypothetical protein BroJett033_3410 [Chloroflexota bacterium]|nr:MAG: hypothetical protein BroJett033_3410 [Chloroflexota bacterium]